MAMQEATVEIDGGGDETVETFDTIVIGGGQLLEHRPGSVDLEGKGILVPERPARAPNQHACPSSFVGSFELLPDL